MIARILRLLGLLYCVMLAGSGVRAEEPARAKPAATAIETYLAREARALGDRFLDGATTRAEWEARKPRLRREYLDMLGLWPLPPRTALHPEITGTIERGNVVIDKLHFQSRPHLYVTGNLYRPKETSNKKLPAVLYLCGHSGRGRDGNKTAFQDHGMWFASNGYVCLVLDTLQLGEVAGIHHGTYREGRWWWQAAGYTPAGVECWNGIRAIDYLISRPDVDPERVGVTGISGGGAATIWIAAADERVRCAVPVSGMSDLESYVSNKIINSHCDCMLMINTYGWEWTTIAALIAPRPLLFCNSDNDRIFPMDANRRISARLRQVYKLHDRPALMDDYVSAGGHDYRPDLRLAIFRWMNKHLKNDTSAVKDADFEPLAGTDLRVFPTNRDLPRDALNNKIDEIFVSRADVKLPAPGQFAEWQKRLKTELREHVFRSFPNRIPAATRVEAEKPADVLETEHGIFVDLYKKAQPAGPKAKNGILIVLDPRPNLKDGIPLAETTLAGEGTVRVLTLHRERCYTTAYKEPPNYVPRSHALLGRSMDQGSVWDIAATARYLAETEKDVTGWKVVGRGQAGVLAAYAALLEPSISEVVVIDPPASHEEGPIFLNVLRVLDVPEALGLLAPTPLTLVNAEAAAAQRVSEIYRLAGVGEKLHKKQAAFR